MAIVVNYIYTYVTYVRIELEFFQLIEMENRKTTTKIPSSSKQTQSTIYMLKFHRLSLFQVSKSNMISHPKVILLQLKLSFTVSGCTACSCDCAVIVEESCNCHAPCPCECCAEQCCERPPSPCNGCTVPVEVVTTVEIVETCAVYDKVVVNDEPQLIEMNRTFSSSYEITESELAKQKQEIEAFQNEIQSNRKGICGNSGIFGIRGDEEQSISINASQALLPNKTGMSNQTRGGGGVIASLVNYNNNRPIKPCQIVSGWSCRKFGKYPHPTNCQKVGI